MKNVIIIATGAVAAEITSYIEDTDMGIKDGLCIKGYLEYEYNIEKYYNNYHYLKPILGDIDSYYPQEDDYFILGVSNIPFREKVIETMKSKNAKFCTIIHPSSIIAKTAKIGEGCFISPFCTIGPNASIGNFNHLTSYSFISHDSEIGNNNVLSSAGLCGHVKIGNNNSFYVRSVVIPEITIGDNCVIQAGMVVDKNVPDNSIIFHRFKEKVIAVPQESLSNNK